MFRLAQMLKVVQRRDIYAVVAYQWSYLSSLDHAPFTVQQLGRLHDIGHP